MGLLDSLRDGATKTITRFVTLLDEDPEHDSPEMQAELAFCTQDQLDRVGKPFRNRAMDPAQEQKFRAAFAEIAWKGVREIVYEEQERGGVKERIRIERPGICRNNLLRLSEFFLLHPDSIAELPAILTPDGDDRKHLARYMAFGAWQRFQAGVLSLEEFQRDHIEREKKEHKATSASA